LPAAPIIATMVRSPVGTLRLARMKLCPMSEDEFQRWRERSIESYGADVARATGRPVEAARERASKQIGEMLPDGLNSANTWLMIICDDNDVRAGTLWIGKHPEHDNTAYIYDIEVDESRRGEGLGRAALIAAEQLVRDAGFREIGLNVFGFNDTAQRLYASLDYRVIATQMTKRLG
jgi:ribosomal protein S18 acetylase RimI-like enzyme